jgi:hypothetical protein
MDTVDGKVEVRNSGIGVEDDERLMLAEAEVSEDSVGEARPLLPGEPVLRRRRDDEVKDRVLRAEVLVCDALHLVPGAIGVASREVPHLHPRGNSWLGASGAMEQVVVEAGERAPVANLADHGAS